MTPFVSDPDFTLWNGDVRDVLAGLPAESVDCALTSPPFYALRDYGTGQWEGGDADCDHAVRPEVKVASSTLGGGRATSGHQREGYKSECGRCGAQRVDRQIGLEDTPEEWAQALVGVFRELRRVLKPQGTLWVECGDSYASAGVGGSGGNRTETREQGFSGSFKVTPSSLRDRAEAQATVSRRFGVKSKDLLGQPWLLAFALRADGWWLRQAIVWHKPNAMPESATDRCTTAHSYVFLLSKQARYHFDAEAIAEPAEWARWGDQTVPKYEGTDTASGWMQPKTKAALVNRFADGGGRFSDSKLRDDPGVKSMGGRADRADGLKNARSVWTIPTQGYPDAHFATWPEALVERIIKAGCPAGGTVLDPFMGSGTTALVARRLGRRSIGIELNESYCALAAKRLGQQSLLADLEGAA